MNFSFFLASLVGIVLLIGVVSGLSERYNYKPLTRALLHGLLLAGAYVDIFSYLIGWTWKVLPGFSIVLLGSYLIWKTGKRSYDT